MLNGLWKKAGWVTLLAVVAFSSAPPKKLTLWMIGDSTMSVKEVKYYPETGWGMPFSWFFDSTVRVEDRARNGRSTRTFRNEKLWQPIYDQLQPGDYVFIQFGHNDEVPTKRSATTPDEFRANLERYVKESRDKKALPVLLTPVARRNFDSTGTLVPTHEQYSGIVREVAKKYNVPLIDLDLKSQALLREWGPEKSRLLYNQLQPGENPNYPKGKEDNTHFNELGARTMAQLVLKEMIAMKLPLAERVVNYKELVK